MRASKANKALESATSLCITSSPRQERVPACDSACAPCVRCARRGRLRAWRHAELMRHKPHRYLDLQNARLSPVMARPMYSGVTQRRDAAALLSCQLQWMQFWLRRSRCRLRRCSLHLSLRCRMTSGYHQKRYAGASPDGPLCRPVGLCICNEASDAPALALLLTS